MKTTNDLLMEVVAKLCPKTMAHYKKTGKWGPDHPRTQSPYVIKVMSDGGRMVQVSGEQGDVVGGVGATTALAVAHLRKKTGFN